MALTPLEVEVLNTDGSPAAGATIELRHELTGVTADGHNRDGSVMTPPILTDSQGAAVTWLPNGIFQWQATGTVTTAWRAFRAYAGAGREAYLSATPAAALPWTDTFTLGDGGIDNLVGQVEVTLNFDHAHMADLVVLLVAPYESVRVLATVGGPASVCLAVDGSSNPMAGETVEVRDAVTGSAAALTDAGGTPLSTPYLTGAGGEINDVGGYLPPGIYEWRVATSANLAGWTALPAALDVSPPWLWFGANNVATTAMADFAFDGTVTFIAATGNTNLVAFSPGARLGVQAMTNLRTHASDGDWKLWVAGGIPGTPGVLSSCSLTWLPV